MNELLPIIEQLANARDDLERGQWLLRCPLDILGRYDATIRTRLMIAGFLPGLRYLDDIRIMKSAVRDHLGRLTDTQTGILTDAACRMMQPYLPQGAAGDDQAAPEQGVTDL